MHNSMCLSLLKIPRYTHACSMLGRFPKFIRQCNTVSTIKIIGSSNSDLDRRQYRRQSRKPINTQPETIKTPSLSSKGIVENDTSKEAAAAASVKADTIRSLATGLENMQIFRLQQMIDEQKDLAELVTFISFDLETSGFRRFKDRIVEVACQDLGGGKNSTFQTLVNPQCFITNHEIHHITTHMVNRPDVPRMEDLIPILIKWIESRRKPNGIVVLIAHNARSFDVPFLTNEFSRCSYEIPSNWFFLDTLPLAREVVKSRGLTGNVKLSLGSLCELYNIGVPNNAHRALVDVKMLSLVYQRMTFELQFSIHRVLEEVFRQSEASNLTKKKKNGGKT